MSSVSLITSPIFGIQPDFSEYPLKFRRLSLTSAQLKALSGAPLTIVPAPGPNLLQFPIALAAHYFFGTAGYTLNAGVMKLYFGTVAAGHAFTADIAAGSIDQAANRVLPFIPLVKPGTIDTDANTLNQPLVIGNDTVNQFTVGAGTITFYITYASFLLSQ